MADSAVAPLFSFIGWSFLPNIASSFIQNIYYKVTLPAGTPPPQPGTPRFARDHRRIRLLVLTLYLLYTLAQALYDIKIAGDFYTILGLNPYTTNEREIRSKFRRLAAKYHPDKIGGNGSTDTHFLRSRLASETLTNGATRYAYDHFGPSVLSTLAHHQHQQRNLEEGAQPVPLPLATLIPLAFQAKLPSYAMTLVSTWFMNTFFLPTRHGQFWRYYILAASFALELYLLTHAVPRLPASLESAINFTRSVSPTVASHVPPHLLPYQILSLAQTLAFSLNIFISQIGAVLPQSPGTGGPSLNDLGSSPAALSNYLTGLNNTLSALQHQTQRIGDEAQAILALQFAPFKGDPQGVKELRRGMKDGVVWGVIRGEPEVREAVKKVVERRKRQRTKEIGQRSETSRGDGADVVDLLESDVQLS